MTECHIEAVGFHRFLEKTLLIQGLMNEGNRNLPCYWYREKATLGNAHCIVKETVWVS